MGGIVDIQVARKHDVLTIPDPVEGVVYGDITFKPGTGFVQWQVTQQSAGIRSNSRTTREGPSKSNQLPLRIPKDRALVRRMLDLAENDEFIVLFKYPTSKLKLFGLLDAPVRFEYDHDGGTNFADGNFYNARFYFEGPDNTYFYEGAIATPPPGASPAVVRVNGEVVASLLPGESINFDTDFDFDFEIVGT